MFLLLPTIAMSLGWALRGTIGGGQLGALIPGAMVMLCLCWLLRIDRNVGILTAIGTVAIGLGGQETYGQTIGFLRSPDTRMWGLLGLTIKGAMWGLSGGVLVGLAFMRGRYRWFEIAIGLAIMVGVTVLGVYFVDEPKLAYFSNRLDKPRDEVWVGVTWGALALVSYLLMLRRETVSAKFALVGLLAGAAGFGGGGLFIAYGVTLKKPYKLWPWWKMMEFSFGALYGLGLGIAAYLWRSELRAENVSSHPTQRRDDFHAAPMLVLVLLGLVLSVGTLWLNFTIPHRAAWSFIAPVLILISLMSNRLAWQIALSLTISGFLRDFLVRAVKDGWMPSGGDSWLAVLFVTLPIVALVVLMERQSLLTVTIALLGLTWLATAFGLIKMGLPFSADPEKIFVPAMFILELLLTTAILMMWGRNPTSSRQDAQSLSSP